VLLGEFDRQAQAVGLVTTTGTVTHTGVAGLTLGGGMGRLARKFGLACDNVLSVDIVTANGKLVTANERENRDLFWAVRGGGGNFGVVTAFEFQLHTQDPTVLGGAMLFPFTNARATLAALAEFAEGAPDEMWFVPVLVSMPQGRTVGFELCYSGSPAEGERLIAPLKRLGKPVMEEISAMPYLAAQASGDLPPGRNYYFKSGFVPRADARLIDEVVKRFETAPPSLKSIPLIHLGGAVGRVKPDATPFWNRDAQHDLAVWAGWDDRSESERNVAAIREVWRSFEPLTKGYYINTDSPDDERRLKLTYGGNYARLVQIKNTYDPTNLFRLNANIRPTEASS
jgi:FAD/FMN-containing dehydrogenase